VIVAASSSLGELDLAHAAAISPMSSCRAWQVAPKGSRPMMLRIAFDCSGRMHSQRIGCTPAPCFSLRSETRS